MRKRSRFTHNLSITCGFVLAGVALTSANLGAGVSSNWQYWRYSRSIDIPAVATSRLVSITVPPELYAHSRRALPDLRIVDDTRAEIPFVRVAREGSTTSIARNVRVLEKSFLPGQYTQLVIDLQAQSPFHNAIELQTGLADFIEWVRVEASDDAQRWRIVEERAPIFRFRKEGRNGTQTVHYSENNARYLRVRVFEPQKQFPVGSVRISYEVSQAPERARIPVRFTPDVSCPPEKSAWLGDLQTSELPVAEVRFEASTPEFARDVEIATGNDGKQWEPFTGGEIYRFHQESKTQEQLAIPVHSFSNRRYWRVTILNGNDAPLTDATPTLYMTPLHLAFEQHPGRAYRLLYGQSETSEARYDLGRIITSRQIDAAIPVDVGPEETNTHWKDPRPFTERYDAVLWLMLAIAVAVLAYSALRSLRRSAHSPENA